MTRNERPGSGLDDEDFYAWTQRQAAVLRALPQASVALALDGIGYLDNVHLAEEIEDLETRDLREVVSSLRRVLQRLVKLRALPASHDAAHWHAEAVNFQAAAREAFSPSMRCLIDVDDIWIGACRAAGRVLPDAGARNGSTDPCPLHPRRATIPRLRRGRGGGADRGIGDPFFHKKWDKVAVASAEVR